MVVSRYIFHFVLPLVLTLVFTPLAGKMGMWIGAVDVPGGRKPHTKPTPATGGLALYLALLPGLCMALPQTPQIRAAGVGMLIIVALGFMDDVWGLNAWTKLGVEIIAAAIPVAFGLRFEVTMLPPGGYYGVAGVISSLLTLAWIVGVTNGMNLIDGLDGLAGGVAGMAGLTAGLIAGMNGQVETAIAGFAVAGACVGFLRYNLYPGTVFLGDTGALSLGYLISIAPVLGLVKGTGFLSMFIAVFIVAIPLLDTAVSIIRRVAAGRPVFEADRQHIHHRLSDRFGQRNAVYIIYCVSVLCDGMAIMLGGVPVVYYCACASVFLMMIAGLTWIKSGCLDSEVVVVAQVASNNSVD